MHTVILELIYADDVDFSSVEALVDAHSGDEGLVAISGRLSTQPAVRIVDGLVDNGGDPDDDTDKLVGADETRWEDPRDTTGGDPGDEYDVKYPPHAQPKETKFCGDEEFHAEHDNCPGYYPGD